MALHSAHWHWHSIPLLHSLTHSTHSPTHPLSHSPTHLLTHSPTHPLTHSPTHPLTHSPTHPLTPTHPLAHSPTHPLTHSLTHYHTRNGSMAHLGMRPNLRSSSLTCLLNFNCSCDCGGVVSGNIIKVKEPPIPNFNVFTSLTPNFIAKICDGTPPNFGPL